MTIGAVEGAILGRALAAGWTPPGPPAHRSGRTAAVIGAGPAGLACAERLNAAGWTVTVYDRNREIGGLLATGVPPFKLDKALLARRRGWLEAAGVRLELGDEVDGARVRRLAAETRCPLPRYRRPAAPARRPARSGPAGALDALACSPP